MSVNESDGARPVITLILPFYLQKDHMRGVIDDFRRSLEDFGQPFEIIVVDNGVADLPQDEREKIVSESPRIVHGELKKKGWGLALRWAIKRARGEYVCYTNSARTEGADVMRLFRYALLSKNAIVKASRPERTRTRKWVSIFFNMENRILLGTPAWDINAAPKIIPKKVLDALTLVTEDELFDAELLYRAFENRVPIIEVPFLKWNRKAGESTTNWMTAVRLAFGVFRFYITTLLERSPAVSTDK